MDIENSYIETTICVGRFITQARHTWCKDIPTKYKVNEMNREN